MSDASDHKRELSNKAKNFHVGKIVIKQNSKGFLKVALKSSEKWV